MVVFDDEQHRHFLDGGDVERFVELARAGAAVADDRQAEHLFPVVAGGPGSAHDHAEHLPQVADHGEPPRGGVAMMARCLRRHASGCRFAMYWQTSWYGVAPSSKMAGEITVQ